MCVHMRFLVLWAIIYSDWSGERCPQKNHESTIHKPVEEIICVRKTSVDLILVSSTCINKPPTAAYN